MSLKDWIYQNTKVIETDPYGPLEVDPVLSRAGYKSRGLNTCNIFMKFITKQIYDEVIEKLRAAGGNDNYIKAVKSAASIISINPNYILNMLQTQFTNNCQQAVCQINK